MHPTDAIRDRVLKGDTTVTMDEMRTLLSSVRRGYRAAQAPKASKSTKVKAGSAPKSGLSSQQLLDAFD